MKVFKWAGVIVAVYVVFVLAFETLYLVSKPSDDQVEKAVREAVKREGIPVSWVGNLLGCRGAAVSTVSVVQVGSYHDQFRYWPMKIRVAGRCRLKDPLKFGEQRSFDNVAEFLVMVDDYGDWTARLKEGTFQ